MTRHALMSTVLGLALGLGCGEPTSESATPAAPTPVAPVEVSTEQTDDPAQEDAPDDDVAALRARVTELEQQLAQCQGSATPSGTETAAIPEVEPEPVAATTPATTTASNNTTDAGPRRARRTEQRDPSLIDTILGTDGRRRRRGDNDTIEIPMPGSLLGQ